MASSSKAKVRGLKKKKRASSAKVNKKKKSNKTLKVRKSGSKKATRKAANKPTKKVQKKSKKKASTRLQKKPSSPKSKPVTKKSKGALKIPAERARTIYNLMVQSRVLEERMIQVYRKGKAYFWIGAPGEEAFGVPLGLLSNPGQGPAFDYYHLHYRGTPTLLALGMDPKDALRLIMNKATDTSTGGRNFSNHYCYPQWNVVPVSSPIEVQYSVAIGTGIAQRRAAKGGVSIITGGDAGSAEGDFASCLIWSSRPGFELPLYITVQNNRWGISTPYETQHGEKHVSDRGKAFGLETRVYNGNDVEEVYLGVQSDLKSIRKNGKPIIAEFAVSRLNGHSSASGANRIESEEDCLLLFEKRLIDTGTLKENEMKAIHKKHFDSIQKLAGEVASEVDPTAETLWDHSYFKSENADWRKF